MKIDIVMRDTPKLSKPLVICGLPGSALVGKVAADHLIETLPCKLLCDIYCEGLPPQVFIEEDGIVSATKNRMYYWQSGGNVNRDLILYTGDAQPTTTDAEYTLSDRVIDFVQQEYGIDTMITLGAYATGNFSQSPLVYAAVTDENLSSRLVDAGCKMMQEGVITGMNGLLLGMAKLKKLSGYALLGETSGYAIDPKASEAILIALSKLTGVSVDLKELDERAKEAQAILKAVESPRGIGSPELGEEKKPGYIT